VVDEDAGYEHPWPRIYPADCANEEAGVYGQDDIFMVYKLRARWRLIEIPQPEDPRGDNLCAVGGAGYDRRRRPVGVGRLERQKLSGPRRHHMLNNDSISVPPRPRLLRRTH
jgi:hypothetical protein